MSDLINHVNSFFDRPGLLTFSASILLALWIIHDVIISTIKDRPLSENMPKWMPVATVFGFAALLVIDVQLAEWAHA